MVLSGGMDAQLKIWSAEDANCVVTFKGHKGGMNGDFFFKAFFNHPQRQITKQIERAACFLHKYK